MQIMCHTAAQRQKRKILASMSAEKRRRQVRPEQTSLPARGAPCAPGTTTGVEWRGLRPLLLRAAPRAAAAALVGTHSLAPVLPCPQYDAEVEAPAPARSQRAAAAAAHADDYGGDDDDDGRDRPGGHSDRAAQKVLRDNTSANGQLFTLQTDLFVMKVRRLNTAIWSRRNCVRACRVAPKRRGQPAPSHAPSSDPQPPQAKLARRDRDNMALQRLLQDATTVSGPPGPAAVAPGLAGLAGLPLGVTGVAMGLQGLNPIGISQIGMGVGPGAALGAAGLGPHAVLGLTPVSAARHAGDSSGRGTSETWTASDPMARSAPATPAAAEEGRLCVACSPQRP